MSQGGRYNDDSALPDIEKLTGDVGGAVGPDVAYNISLLGGNNITTTGTPASHQIEFDLTGTTDHAVQVGNATGSLNSIAAGTTGELLIGATGGDPAFGSTAYADFSFANITGVGVPRSLTITNTDVNVASTSDLRISVPPLGGDGMLSFEIQGSSFYSFGIDNSDSDTLKITTSSDPSTGTEAFAVDNATAAITFANAYEFPVADGDANDVLITDGGGNLDFGAITTIIPTEEQIYYVGKHGDDTNSGLNIENAVLTFGQALTLATAATPAADNRFSIVCLDDGIYTENITCVQYVDVYAPNAKLVGTITGTDDVSVKFRAQDVATGTTGISKTAGTGYFFIEIEDINVAGTGIGLISTAGFTNIIWKTMYIENGFGIGDLTAANGHIHIKGGDIYISGTGIGLARANAGTTVGRLDHILDTGGGNGTALVVATGEFDVQISRIQDCNIGLDVNGGTANIVVSTIDCTTAYDISGGALYLHVCQLTGTETSTGGTRKIVSAEDGINNVVIGDTVATTATFTTANATTFDTNVAAAAVTLTGTTLSADGTDANIDIELTPKGTGVLLTQKIGNAADTTAINITAAGEVTEPLQPAFSAYRNANLANQTGNGATITVPYDTERFDVNSDYNTGTYTFTAPVTGKYRFSVAIGLYSLTAAMTQIQTTLVTSNQGYTFDYSNAAAQRDGTNDLYISEFSVLVDMDATDTAYVETIVSNGAGNTAGILGLAGGTSYVLSGFTGQLEC